MAERYDGERRLARAERANSEETTGLALVRTNRSGLELPAAALPQSTKMLPVCGTAEICTTVP